MKAVVEKRRQSLVVGQVAASSFAASPITGTQLPRQLPGVAALASAPALTSSTTTIHIFLKTSIPAAGRTWFPPGGEAAERAQRDITHPHLRPPFLSERVVRHRLVQKAHSRSNSATASLHPEFPRSTPTDPTPTRSTYFHCHGWAAGPCETLNKQLGAANSTANRRMLGGRRRPRYSFRLTPPSSQCAPRIPFWEATRSNKRP